MRKLLYSGMAIFVLFLAVAGIYMMKNFSSKTALPILVKRADIAEEVFVTGQVKPEQDVALSFNQTGKISDVRVGIGANVYAGQVLAVIDQGDLPSQLLDAEARILAEIAKLSQLKKGTRPEEISVQEAKVASGENSIEDAKNNLIDRLKGAYTVGDDAIRNQANQLFNNPTTANPTLIFQADSNLSAKLIVQLVVIENLLKDWEASLRIVNSSSDLVEHAKSAKSKLDKINFFLNDLSVAVNSLSQSVSISQTTVSGWKSSISTARSNIQTSTNSISVADEKLRSAISALNIEKSQLDLEKAGTTAEDIAIQESVLRQAEVKKQGIKANISQTILYSPIDGVVTKQDAKIGQISGANSPIINVFSKSISEITAYVPEVDIGHVEVGNFVNITLDAFPGESFTGRVSYIEPAETVVSGVVNFKITVKFDKKDPRFKSGLTANLKIKTEEKKQVLVIPQFTLSDNDIGTFVKKVSGKQVTDVQVVTGIRDQNGNVEIISGLNEGDEVENIGLKIK